MQFTSSIPLSTEKTPLSLDWAEENYELVSQVIKCFFIGKQANLNCFLSCEMDEEGNEWWKLSIHYATFDVEYVEEVEFLLRTFGIESENDKQQKNNVMKEAKIEIPNGKTAKWVNNVLTLVDDKPQNVMELIKTFRDALIELSHRAKHGDEDAKVLLDQYDNMNLICSKDLLAYLKLCIITSALNEGWKHKFTEDERRWYPWFELDGVVGRGGDSADASFGLVCAGAVYASSYSHTGCGSQLAFKSKELAEYAGNQFINIYTYYFFNTNERLEPELSKNEVGTTEQQIKTR